jgi:hypothetical protein
MLLNKIQFKTKEVFSILMFTIHEIFKTFRNIVALQEFKDHIFIYACSGMVSIFKQLTLASI